MLCRALCLLLLIGWIGEWPLESGTGLYCELWRSPLFVLAPLFRSVPGVNMLPWQILVIALAPACLASPGAFAKRALPMDAAIVTSYASVAVTFLWGVLQGGSAYQAYYQLWRFLTALLLALMLTSAIRRPRDLRALGLTVLLAALVRAGLCIYFYWGVVHGNIDPIPDYMTTHDDTMLFIAGLLVVLSWALVRRRWSTWFLTALVSVFILYAIVLNDRRLAWMELVLGLTVVYLMLPRGGLRRRINWGLVLAFPVLLAYFAAGWSSDSPVFAPVRALAVAAGGQQDNSSLARQEEIRNLLYTLTFKGNPLLGTGWGVPYEKVTSVYANYGPEWWQYLYLPHNSLIGVGVYAGLAGLFGIWMVVPMAAHLGARGHRDATGSVDRAAAMAAVSILPAYGAQCYGDVGFQSLTSGLVLAAAIATISKVYGWSTSGGGPSASHGAGGGVLRSHHDEEDHVRNLGRDT